MSAHVLRWGLSFYIFIRNSTFLIQGMSELFPRQLTMQRQGYDKSQTKAEAINLRAVNTLVT